MELYATLGPACRDGETPAVDVAGLHIQVERIEDHRIESALVSKAEPEEKTDGE